VFADFAYCIKNKTKMGEYARKYARKYAQYADNIWDEYTEYSST
jgi:hypothetical protein